MPVLNNRYSHVKVYRPTGTLWAEATERITIKSETAIAQTLHIFVGMAVEKAFRAFRTEFGRPPELDRLIVEVNSTTGAARAVVYELPEEV